MTKTFRFRLPDVPPGVGVEPRPGLPVRGLRVIAIVAPVVCLTAFALVVRRRR
ncbi:hypothetical protein [Amycolatopsis sp. FDAARGOS 1241]|uniref:hypothetical protein n=1 Tax=Amycolatopsis sp. FDAARGOS 1241 TaxID=2778070 RepID=UPI00194FAC3E|nr:hypothetical protein [Amycolatopsis sp. FDAARGOS 1241]QRP47887.1 hypothetical protein I6J71_08240 [Amycolatopsis sp. FDAARGOS 1241]